MNRVTRKHLGIVLILLLSFFSGAARADEAKESPFGFHPAAVAKPGYTNNGYGDAENIGVKWTRVELYALWFLIQPDLDSPTYDFSRSDQLWSRVPTGMNILANIAPQGPIDEGRCLANSYFPVDEQKYIAFVKAVVQRYGGSSYADAGLAAPVKYWQVGNEPNGTKGGFADLQRVTYTAIKEVCPDCTVLIGGVTGMPPVDTYIASFDQDYKPILDALGGQYIDVMDFHWYGAASGDYRGVKEVYEHIRSVLNNGGFPANLPVWITEMGAYSGAPRVVGQPASGFDFPAQTEREQAMDYFKRFVYPLSFGVKKIFPAFGLMEGFKHDNGYFDHTGLIYDGADSGDAGLGVKKLGYYTYKKMTGLLEGSDWNSIRTIQASDNVYIFKFTKNNAPVYVAWWDYFNDPNYLPGAVTQVALSGRQGATARSTKVVPKFSSGAEVTDYSSAFTTVTEPVAGGLVTINLDDSPVIIEEIIPRITASPASTDFGIVNSGSSSSAQTFTITNNGSADLVIGTVSVGGVNEGQFSKQSDGCANQTIVPKGNCTVQVIFSPTSAGSKNANFLINSSDPYTPTLSIPL